MESWGNQNLDFKGLGTKSVMSQHVTRFSRGQTHDEGYTFNMLNDITTTSAFVSRAERVTVITRQFFPPPFALCPA
jgi:hypothetical protein